MHGNNEIKLQPTAMCEEGWWESQRKHELEKMYLLWPIQGKIMERRLKSNEV